MRQSPLSRGEEVFATLRSELLNGLFQPAQKLRMVELSTRFGVSQSVVREALTRLAEQGLIVATPQRGFRVRELSVKDITGLTEARVEIEQIAMRLSVARGDVEWETGVVAAHHLLERTPVLKDDGTVNEEWSVRHQQFHVALLAGCDNARLEGVAQALRDSAELYRRWTWVLVDDHGRDLDAEHRQLKDLAVARDGEAVVKLLTEHIERAPRQLIAYAHQHGLDTIGDPENARS
jgi:DNA-binding GntR family transcriptional regulator